MEALIWIVDLFEDVDSAVRDWLVTKVQFPERFNNVGTFIWIVDLFKGVLDVYALVRIVDLVEFVRNVHFFLDTIDLIEDFEDISLFFFASFLHRSVVVIENSREIWSGAELTIITEAQDCECYDCEQMEGCAKAATASSNFSCRWEDCTNH